MRVGVLLPTFRATPEVALAQATAAARAGVDGVFVYDHLYPMGHPDRPALSAFPVLAAVAVTHPGLWVGPLVARVGVVSTELLVAQFATLNRLAGGRVVAALGTGDQLSAQENLTYGLAYGSAAARRALVADAVIALRDVSEIWVGAGAAATDAMARSLNCTLNLWERSVDEVRVAAAQGPVSWAGHLDEDGDAHLDALARAGATWVVCAPDSDLDALGRWRERHRDAQ